MALEGQGRLLFKRTITKLPENVIEPLQIAHGIYLTFYPTTLRGAVSFVSE